MKMETETVTLISLVVGQIVGLVALFLKMRQDTINRVQDREDKRLEAELTLQYRTGLKKEVLQTRVVAAKGVRKAMEAIDHSNGIKEDLVKNGVKLITDSPLPVVVENTSDKPVPTHDTH